MNIDHMRYRKSGHLEEDVDMRASFEPVNGANRPRLRIGEVVVKQFALKAIGTVTSSLTDLESAPRQPDEGAPQAWLVLDEDMADGLQSIRPGDEILLITWLDRARRDVLTVHPRGDPNRALAGVFSTRSPHRPNPLGLHRVEVIAVDGCRLQVRSLEAVDGTPILDIKPILADEIHRR